MTSFTEDMTVARALVVLALMVWMLVNVQVRRENGRWIFETEDALFLLVLAIYARFA